MSLAFVYDPAVLPDPMPTVNAINAGLPAGPGSGTQLGWFFQYAQAPASWQSRIGALPAAGYAVLHQRWNGVDILPGPVTAAQILALPADTPPDSAVGAYLDAISTILGDAPPNLSQLQTDVSNLRAYVALASPTAAQAEAALAALIRVTRSVAYLAVVK